MPQLILIKTPKFLEHEWDYVDVYEDNTVDPHDVGNSIFHVVQISGTVKEIKDLVWSTRPEIIRYEKSGKIKAQTKIGQWIDVVPTKYHANIPNGDLTKIHACVFK